MLITKTSTLTGKVSAMELDVTEEQLHRIEIRWETKELIQNIVPHLSPSEREFLITGITPEEWNDTFGVVKMDAESDTVKKLLSKKAYPVVYPKK